MGTYRSNYVLWNISLIVKMLIMLVLLKKAAVFHLKFFNIFI